MNIAIIGAGQVGQALATALRRGGHGIVFGVRDDFAPDRRPVAEAVTGADATLLALPFEAALALVADPVFAGRIVIDATNPLRRGPSGLALSLGHATSGAEQLAAAAPSARIVKAFNQTGFENLADAPRLAARPVMFVATDDAQARAVTQQLVTDAGFEAVDAGPLAQARLLEPLAMIWISLARLRGLGPDFAFAFTHAKPA